MGSNTESITHTCRLCGGRIEGHRVTTGTVVRGKVVRTTCAKAGERLDAQAQTLAYGVPVTPWAERLGKECQARREAAKAIFSQPLHGWELVPPKHDDHGPKGFS